MVDVPGDLLRLPHCTTSSAVKADKNTKVHSFKSSEYSHKKVDGPFFEVSAKKRQKSSRNSGRRSLKSDNGECSQDIYWWSTNVKGTTSPVLDEFFVKIESLSRVGPVLCGY